MSVSPTALAAAMATGIGQSAPTSQLSGFAKGILEELTQHGMASSGPPSGNTISGMSGSSMATKVAGYAGYPNVSAELMGFCSAIVSHIESAGLVSYTGPGPVFFLGGTISGLSGSAMASGVMSSVGYPSVTSQLSGMCGAIASHIMSNAEVNSGTIS